MPMTWTHAVSHWHIRKKNGQPPPCMNLPWPDPGKEIPPSLQRALAARALCEGQETRPPHVLQWLALNEVSLDLPLPLADCLIRPWLEVPVAVVGKTGHAEVIYILLAALDHSGTDHHPKGWTDQADSEAKEATSRALEHAAETTGCGYALWPRSTQPVSGASLGLPLHLAALFLGRNALPPDHPFRRLQSWPRALATGKVERGGRVLPVNGIKDKSSLLRWSALDLPLLLYPEGCAEKPEEARSFPVSHVDEACHLLACPEMQPQAWRTILSFKQNPMLFWRGLQQEFADLPREHFDLFASHARRTGCFELEPEQKIEALGHACTFLEREKNKDQHVHLLPPFTLDFARALSPWDAFRLSQRWIKFLAHQGSPEAHIWRSLAHERKDQVCQSQQGQQDVIAFLARELELAHNRYDFFDDPEDLLDFIKIQAARLCEDRVRYPSLTNDVLAKAYNMLSQHRAFQGRHKDALDFVKRYEDAAHGTLNARSRALFSKAFVYWDMGLGAEAERCARQHLENHADDKYAHALHARWACEGLALSVDEASQARRKLHELEKNPPDSIHPWQLWAYNMGCALNDAAFLRASHAFCSKAKSSIRPMGLLPLAALHARGLDHEAWLRSSTEKTLQDLRALCAEHTLNKEHFAPLLKSGEWHSALALLHLQRQRFFPFTYR